MPTTAPAPTRTSQLLLWLCVGALAVTVLCRQLVLCRHDGITRIEFTHEDGACCLDPLAAHALPGDRGCDVADTDPTCEHFDLAVQLAPPPCAQATLPAAPVAFAPACEMTLPAPPRNDVRLLPPPTGPPRPRSFLRLHRTVVLLS